ncbi:2,3-bisphosphoglycerate-independent phosphoglycerate mutase [Kiloniella laminariae]|uniref:2,3-bisphosphoglycerate-independent phosphoglycerate mutase n=1 Tax=Kiloniella laminariae TaxID=454162 RepID=A0ABT4LNL2_9PROT|nr:2,3-bisphosphoglycerate-independent phosphoglycerate mutase [Kiloniella laminariae]MCZ4282480.1 2,3-bisphosphoglycerate-independent phosphoglycerate mutase [Kiloniella laminariae]
MSLSTALPKPVVLCILDGWGFRKEDDHNAINLAKTPLVDRLSKEVPLGYLATCGRDVGLPDGQMGNSEVGHMNIGAGRVVMQDLPLIDTAIEDGSFARIPALLDTIRKLEDTGGTAHVLGVISNGGVHGHQAQTSALVRILQAAGIPVVVHAILDGRDTAPQSAIEFIKTFESSTPGVVIGTVLGRYYAMDRDNRWERVEKAYDAITLGQGEQASSPETAISRSYEQKIWDEFVLPCAIADYQGMNDGDALIMTNFRADRARQILHAFIDKDFAGFTRQKHPACSAYLGMVAYSDELAPKMGVMFPPKDLTKTLGEIVSAAGLSQFRIAETEKYPHVTYFFNGGQEQPLPGEHRVMVPSPKVATYDLQPEMSAREVCDKLCQAITSGTYQLLICNFANCDMVGHTGSLEAAIKAAETVDNCLQEIHKAVLSVGGRLLITADHGNAEEMLDPVTGQPHTAHTLNPVPILLVNGPDNVTRIENGRLADIAPTILDLLHLDQPSEMDGRSLIHRNDTE